MNEKKLEFNPIIRRAQPGDARGIHDAHMRSIQETCAKDHSPEEIRAWGGRPFNLEQRLHTIKNHMVWVVLSDNAIHGYGHLVIEQIDARKIGHIRGLYLTPEVQGLGLGYRLAKLMLYEARREYVSVVDLASTITAHEFYKKIGFRDSGPETTIEISGVGVRCFPMAMSLEQLTVSPDHTPD